jgi:hypothetical protein
MSSFFPTTEGSTFFFQFDLVVLDDDVGIKNIEKQWNWILATALRQATVDHITWEAS